MNTHAIAPTLAAEGYEPLAGVFASAFEQAAHGKGKERHANDLPFIMQPMIQIGRRRGIGFVLGQADKKTEEAQGMLTRCERQAAVREILGAMVYLAGAVLLIEEGRPATDEALGMILATHTHTIQLAANDNSPARCPCTVMPAGQCPGCNDG